MQKKRKITHSPDIQPIYKAFQHIGAGATEEAINTLMNVTKKNIVEYIDAQILLGKLYSQTDKRAEAEHYFKQVPVSHPEYTEAQIELAHLYVTSQNTRYQEAINCYLAVPIGHKEYLDIQLFLGELYIETDQPDLAQEPLFNVLNHIDKEYNFDKKNDAIHQLIALERQKKAACKETSNAFSEQTLFSIERILEINPPILIDLRHLQITYENIEQAKELLGSDSPELVKSILDEFSQISNNSRFYDLAQTEIAANYANSYDWEAATEILDTLPRNLPSSLQLERLINTIKQEIEHEHTRKRQRITYS